MKMQLGWFFSALLVLAPAVMADDGETPDFVLQQLINSYGGVEHLRKLDRMTQEWDMVALQRHQAGTDHRVVRMPDYLRVELRYPHKRELRMLEGETALVQQDEGHPAPARDAQQQAMRLQLMRLYSPLALWDRRKQISIVKTGDWLALSLKENGLQADYLINDELWRIEKVAGTLQIQGMTMRFLTEYSDFRRVDGVLVHHGENKFAGSVNTARLTLRSIAFHDD